jgi:hypothetical protein
MLTHEALICFSLDWSKRIAMVMFNRSKIIDEIPDKMFIPFRLPSTLPTIDMLLTTSACPMVHS